MINHLKRSPYVYIKRLMFLFSILLVTSLSATETSSWCADCFDSDWTLVHSEKGIEVYSMTSDCKGGDYYFFKVVNHTSHDQNVVILVTVPDEASYGTIKFEEQVAANSESAATCAGNHLRLPNSNAHNRKSLEGITLKLQLK